MILARNNALYLNEVNDVQINLFLLGENEKQNDLLIEVTMMYNLQANTFVAIQSTKQIFHIKYI